MSLIVQGLLIVSICYSTDRLGPQFGVMNMSDQDVAGSSKQAIPVGALYICRQFLLMITKFGTVLMKFAISRVAF